MASRDRESLWLRAQQQNTVLVLSVSQRESLGFFKWITTFVLSGRKTKQKKITFYKYALFRPKMSNGPNITYHKKTCFRFAMHEAFQAASQDMIGNGCTSIFFCSMIKALNILLWLYN